MNTATGDFSPGLLALAAATALTIQGVFLGVLVAAGSTARVERAEPPPQRERPIAVKPVLDELPLLKLGSNKKVKPKLPDMWKKNPPVQRFEEKSAPSPLAKDTPEAIPTSQVAKGDAGAPPPDAEVAKEVDQVLLDAGPDVAAPELAEEGAPDGVKEGTETDPLKARAVSQYHMKILGWFNSRFIPPQGQIPCDELKKLITGVVANVGQDRSVTSYSIVRPSGNATFDAKVKATMDAIVGQELPPPPPLYPDILGGTVQPQFSGAKAQCVSDAQPTPSPNPSPEPSPSPSPEPPSSPAEPE